MRSRLGVGTSILFLSFACSGVAWGWGDDGHETVAMIADMNLTPEARAGVRGLLGDQMRIYDRAVAVWADDYRYTDEGKHTKNWHFIDVPREAEAIDMKRDGKHGNNIVDQLSNELGALSDAGLDAGERLVALKFVVHFFGDIHQPLHCADWEDAGGNGHFVQYPVGDHQSEPVNLHTFWDTVLVKKAMGTDSVRAFAERLNPAAGDPVRAAAGAGGFDPKAWATASHRHARAAYDPVVAAHGQTAALDEGYVTTSVGVVRSQLTLAGLRLANALNKAFATAPHPAAAAAAADTSEGNLREPVGARD